VRRAVFFGRFSAAAGDRYGRISRHKRKTSSGRHPPWHVAWASCPCVRSSEPPKRCPLGRLVLPPRTGAGRGGCGEATGVSTTFGPATLNRPFPPGEGYLSTNGRLWLRHSHPPPMFYHLPHRHP